jgi:serine/threonine protein phosphatase 1
MQITKTPAGASVPAGRSVIAVGDIHGRRDLLAVALEAIRAAAGVAADKGEALTVVFLGDYIDRGPASRGVIEDLLALEGEGACETVFLRGNHEQALIDILDGKDAARGWLEHGGLTTLDSYGAAWSSQGGVRDLPALLRRAIPVEHIAFLRRTRLLTRIGDYVFVHAGLRPGAEIADQTPEDLLWCRHIEEPQEARAFTVVHGHTPNPLPVEGRDRIAIDTKAYASGALTVLRLHGASRRFERAVLPEHSARPRLEPWRRIDRAYRKAARRGGRWDDGAAASPSLSLRRLIIAALALAALLALGVAVKIGTGHARQASTLLHRPG